MTVVDLAEARKRRTPHLQGAAVCTACDHEWQAVAPSGTVWLQCQSCGTQRGLMRHAPKPASVWHCSCGCDAFYISSAGLLCVCCGSDQKDQAP